MAPNTLTRRATSRSSRSSAVPMVPPARTNEVCLELKDHSIVRRSAIDFFQLRGQRDHSQASRLADQFIKQNRALMALLEMRAEQVYDGNDVHLLIESGSAVGAIPLISPMTARPDYGLVVHPRFPWDGVGPMLAEMGWRVSPTPLRLPLLRRSERRVPVWVLSFMILTRLKALLDSMDRQFEVVTEHRTTPRGTVAWASYASRSLGRANLLSIPCTFPDLRDDRLLRGAVRHAVERQLRALDSQREHGAFTHRLIDFAQTLLNRVRSVPVYAPSAGTLGTWFRRPMRAEHFTDGLRAIEWTVEERGLAGLSDLEGIPWRMPMEEFFEAWVETIFRAVASRIGAQIKVGRKRETTCAINWEPSYAGSQKSLAPDIWLELDGTTVIVDAKYKRHWEEFERHPWSALGDELREQHRHDLLQVLAYANLARTPRVIACLAYPCSPSSWESLRDRGRLIHQAHVTAGPRIVKLWLTAVPMSAGVGDMASPLAERLRSVIQEMEV